MILSVGGGSVCVLGEGARVEEVLFRMSVLGVVCGKILRVSECLKVFRF